MQVLFILMWNYMYVLVFRGGGGGGNLNSTRIILKPTTYIRDIDLGEGRGGDISHFKLVYIPITTPPSTLLRNNQTTTQANMFFSGQLRGQHRI